MQVLLSGLYFFHSLFANKEKITRHIPLIFSFVPHPHELCFISDRKVLDWNVMFLSSLWISSKITKFKLKSGGFGEKYTLVNNILGNVTKYSEHLYPKEIALVSVISTMADSGRHFFIKDIVILYKVLSIFVVKSQLNWQCHTYMYNSCTDNFH